MSNKPKPPGPDAKATPAAKKNYHPPVLTNYGTLTEITAGSNATAMNDSGGPSSGKLK